MSERLERICTACGKPTAVDNLENDYCEEGSDLACALWQRDELRAIFDGCLVHGCHTEESRALGDVLGLREGKHTAAATCALAQQEIKKLRAALDKESPADGPCPACERVCGLPTLECALATIRNFQDGSEQVALKGIEMREEIEQLKRERDEAQEALESLESSILEELPYKYDDGEDDDADPGECIGYAAQEIRTLKRERDEARAEAERLREAPVVSLRGELCPACGRATYVGVFEEPCAADSDLACALRQRDVAQVVASQATHALAEAREALGVAWLRGGVSLAEGIRRKTARLEELGADMESASRVQAVGDLIASNGCDCDCDHDAESHDDDCDRCLACRIGEVISDC